eukprot:scaffold13610_cov159-Ochromonas_danica.AAC.9
MTSEYHEDDVSTSTMSSYGGSSRDTRRKSILLEVGQDDDALDLLLSPTVISSSASSFAPPAPAPPPVKEIDSDSITTASVAQFKKKEKPVLSFDPQNIVSGPVVHACRQLSYQGHACTTSSLSQATDIIDYLALQHDSEDCMAFAIRLVEAGELLAIAQDNGDFLSSSSLVSHAIKRLDGFNTLICVTRKVKGVFVADMVSAQRRMAVKQAAEKVADLLLSQLRRQVVAAH